MLHLPASDQFYRFMVEYLNDDVTVYSPHPSISFANISTAGPYIIKECCVVKGKGIQKQCCGSALF
jgi:hypothetical protein